MGSREELRTSDLAIVFAEEVATAGGTVQETYDDGSLLISRAVLPRTAEVAPSDVVRGGIALRADWRAPHLDVCVRPYVFRRVCRNGAVATQAIESRELRASDLPREEAIAELREAIRASAEPAAFTRSAAELSASRSARADVALQLLPLLARLRDHERRTAYAEILIRFLQAGDSSLFGLVNAVTSLARDTGDPQRRWRLEELGGALVRAPRPAPERSGGAVKDIANATTPS